LSGLDLAAGERRRLDCGHWPPFEKPSEWTAQVLTFLNGY
jgi:pimeloyl-ACP methyl ester carboxylesterase